VTIASPFPGASLSPESITVADGAEAGAFGRRTRFNRIFLRSAMRSCASARQARVADALWYKRRLSRLSSCRMSAVSRVARRCCGVLPSSRSIPRGALCPRSRTLGFRSSARNEAGAAHRCCPAKRFAATASREPARARSRCRARCSGACARETRPPARLAIPRVVSPRLGLTESTAPGARGWALSPSARDPV